jgi:hypothetical protein
MKHKLEIYADCIRNAMDALVPSPDFAKAFEEMGRGDQPSPHFYHLAGAIVEPSGIPDDYIEFMEDSQNWVNFIQQIAGDRWREVALLVVEHGY